MMQENYQNNLNVENSNEWKPKVGSEIMELSYSDLVPTKVGNCIEISAGSFGVCDFNPFANEVSTFTLELYVKYIGSLTNTFLMNLTKNMEYGIAVYFAGPSYSSIGQMSVDVDIYNGSTFRFIHGTEATLNMPICVQMTCLNGNLELYIDGNLVSTAKNFSMHMPVSSGSAAFILGDNLSSPSYSTSGPVFASFRYYERSLTKDELDKNRQFDLSIY